jgi:peroxiredoxin
MIEEAAKSAIGVGDRAPDATLPVEGGSPVNLSSLWRSADRGLVLVLLRHFGCLFCKQEAKRLAHAHRRFADAGLTVAVIGVGTPARAARFARDHELPFPVFGDWDLDAYRAFGLGRATASGFLNPAVYRAGLRAVLGGNLPGPPTGDTAQLPGAFVIDPSGIVRFASIGAHPGDNPTTEALLAAIDDHGGRP